MTEQIVTSIRVCSQTRVLRTPYFTIWNIMATESGSCFNTVIAFTVVLYQKLHVIVQIKRKLFPQIALTDCCL